MIYASSAPLVAQSPSGAHIVYFLNLGDAAALGGSLVVSSCTAGNTTIGNTFRCLVGNDYAGDVAGQAACGANAAASTVTIAGTTSRPRRGRKMSCATHRPGVGPGQAPWPGQAPRRRWCQALHRRWQWWLRRLRKWRRHAGPPMTLCL